MRKNKKFIFLVVGVCFLLGWGLHSLLGLDIQPARADIFPKIGYVDFYKIFSEYKKAEDMVSKLEQKRAEYQQTLQEKSDEIERLTKELKDLQENSVISEEAINEREAEIQKKYEDLQSLYEQIKEEIQKQDEEYTEEIKDDIINKVKEIAEEEGYRFVFYKEIEKLNIQKIQNGEGSELVRGKQDLFVYVSPEPEVNLTERVLQELNEEYGGLEEKSGE